MTLFLVNILIINPVVDPKFWVDCKQSSFVLTLYPVSNFLLLLDVIRNVLYELKVYNHIYIYI